MSECSLKFVKNSKPPNSSQAPLGLEIYQSGDAKINIKMPLTPKKQEEVVKA